MHAVKDQETLVRAFALALSVTPSLKKAARLMIIGDGPLRRKLESLVTDLGIAEFAWIPGERQDIPEVLRGLDCFILPSISEGISNTILEAMASGLPVIATDAGGNSELVENRKTGLLVAVQDVEAMASAITACALAPQESKQMGQRGRDEVLQKFSIESMVKSYCDLYASLVAAETPVQST
jgi:glycosyltransferase involved in cell wall biosynthesis